MVYVKKNKLYKMSVESATLFLWAQNSEQSKLTPSINELDIFNNFCICVGICICVLVTFVFVIMFVFDVNECVNSCKVSYNYK
jgi:hypothetical protein